MKKLLALLLALCCVPFACGQYRESDDILKKLVWDDEKLSIMLDLRTDLQGVMNRPGTDTWGFNGQTMKVLAVGQIVPRVSYRLRHRLNRAQDPQRDGFAAATEHLWIGFDAGGGWNFTVGKQSVAFGTFEYDYNFADIYLSTLINNDFDSYKTGVDVSYGFLGQKLHLQVVNSDNPQTASDAYAKKAFAGTVLWEGSFFNKGLRTRMAFSTFQYTAHKFYNWVTLGLQGNLHRFTAELDWYRGERDIDYGAMVGENMDYRNVRDQSVSLNLKVDAGKLHPSVKGIWDQRYDKGYRAAVFENLGCEAVLEYYPFSNEHIKDLRFHAAWFYRHTNFNSIWRDVANTGSHTVLVGVRWLFKVK